ncbi:RNA polymerase sigma factor SigJ [Actinomadura parmotrematis]|uniref:RNA polymerase sigma factor SigJ n=1 Tax=Actinomadura parmotrematis TaxID=2864039 RepID=A0ABS7FWD6_9ACTN|nr:RNA polymerase sigma factor SigJ [Actinomadura parmotrematis]MBW8484290.1 RNA polymerase sigma factor SigJ [Actinomadura parmotrematis]
MSAEDRSAEEEFAARRGLLMGVAYRVLGRVADAEDVVQDAWLRWSGVAAGTVADPEGFLVTVTTRLAIDRLRRVQARRETYIGEWLPEPLLTEPGPDVAEDVIRAESVSLALLVVMETLTPAERAVFVLREVFAFPYPDIAAALGKKEPAVRQLAARARAHVQERRPRFEVAPDRWRQVTDLFAGACLTGGVEGLMDLLAPDVRLVADSGGNAVAPRRAIVGREEVARFVLHIIKLSPSFLRSVGVGPGTPTEYRLVTANGGPAFQVVAGERPIVHFQVQAEAGEGGKVAACYLVVNPEKLGGVLSQDGPALRP